MSEIVFCFTISDTKEIGYFIVEGEISCEQLVDFVTNSQYLKEGYTLETTTEQELNEENLRLLIQQSKAAGSSSPVQITFKKIGEAPKEAESQPEPVEEQIVQEETVQSTIGPTLRLILEKIGVKFESNSLDTLSSLDALPILENEKYLEAIVPQVAQMFDVDENQLLSELQFAIGFVKKSNAPNEQEKAAEEAKREALEPALDALEEEALVLGPMLISILVHHYKKDKSRLESVVDVRRVLQSIPALSCLLFPHTASNPNILRRLARHYVKRYPAKAEINTDVLFDALLEEFKRVNQFFASCDNTESSQQQAVDKHPRIPLFRSRQWRVPNAAKDFHPARCNMCKARISGVRYYCLHCKDYDLCSECEQKNNEVSFHDESHIFAKIKDPNTPYRITNVISRPCVPKQRLLNRVEKNTENRLLQLETTVKQLNEIIVKLQN